MPALDAVVHIRTSDTEVVAAVLDTARLVPDGYTAVPDVAGLGGDEAERQMGEAQLEWEFCPDYALCLGRPV